MPESFVIDSKAEWERLKEHLVAALEMANGKPVTVTIKQGRVRSLDQNALLHKWYGEIAKHFGDRTAAQVKAQCHVDYGVDIRRRDPVFCWIWDKLLAPLGYEKQVAFFEKQYRKVETEGSPRILYMTSVMKPDELSEYMDAMYRDYTDQGVHLTRPDDRKYEGKA